MGEGDDDKGGKVIDFKVHQGGKGAEGHKTQVQVNRSAIRLFSATMEDAAAGKIHFACVVGRALDGGITVRWTQPIDEVQMIGLLELAKQMLLRNMRSTNTPLGEDDPSPSG